MPTVKANFRHSTQNEFGFLKIDLKALNIILSSFFCNFQLVFPRFLAESMRKWVRGHAGSGTDVHPLTPKSLLEKSLKKNHSKNRDNGKKKKKREGRRYFLERESLTSCQFLPFRMG